MHRLVEAQALDIGPVERLKEPALRRHLLGSHQRLERHVFRRRARIGPRDDVGQRKPDPGDHHRPALDAAQPVDPLLQRVGRIEILERVGPRIGHQPVHHHRPRRRGQRVRVLRGILLGGPELVEVVVAGHMLHRRRRVIRRKGAGPSDHARRASTSRQQTGGGDASDRRQHLATPHPRRARRDVRMPQARVRLDQHRGLLRLRGVHPPIRSYDPIHYRNDARMSLPTALKHATAVNSS